MVVQLISEFAFRLAGICKDCLTSFLVRQPHFSFALLPLSLQPFIKAKSPEKTHGMMADVMVPDRCVRYENAAGARGERGYKVF